MEHQKALEPQLKSEEVKVCQKMGRRKVKMHCLLLEGENLKVQVKNLQKS